MVPIQSSDSRGFFVLPQAPEEAGYYTYGTPDKGRAQYADPRMLSLIFAVEWEWISGENRKFGVGNMSKADGVKYEHATHMKGVEVDLRPLRKDGLRLPVSYLSPDYDSAATQKLIDIFRRCFSGQLTIFFNDLRIPGVRPLSGHSNHFHVEFK
jgi:penicillin-insensitive murein endopeptidase